MDDKQKDKQNPEEQTEPAKHREVDEQARMRPAGAGGSAQPEDKGSANR